MIKSLLSFLQERYSENTVNSSYAVIIRAIQRTGGVPSLQNLVMALVSPGKAKTDTVREERREGILDYRVINLSVKSLRKLQTPFGEDEFVGVTFARKKAIRPDSYDYEPVSCLVLGANGIGKTSLFCSFEISAFGSSNIAYSHGYDTVEQQRIFLSHGDGADDPAIRLCTKAGVFMTTIGTGNSKLQSLNLPQAFLCSGFDISRLEKGVIDSEYIMNEMGRPEFLDLAGILRATRDVLSWLDEFKIAGDLLSEAEEGSKDALSLQERMRGFERQIKKKLGIKRLPKPMVNMDDSECRRLIQEIAEILNEVESGIQRIYKTLMDVSRTIMPNILRNFLYDCDLDIRMVNNVPSINLIVKSDDEGKDITIEPRQFFNTFRLKLFAIAVKLSMACCVKIIDKINFPFIIDDTFDASDFISKGEIKNFICNILVNHDGIKALERYPLQLIIFTQDDIIAQKAYQGLSLHGQLRDARPFFLKVYDCKDATSADYVIEKSIGKEISYYNIVDRVIG